MKNQLGQAFFSELIIQFTRTCKPKIPKEFTGLKKKGHRMGAGSEGKGDSQGEKGSNDASDSMVWSISGQHMDTLYVLLDVKK